MPRRTGLAMASTIRPTPRVTAPITPTETPAPTEAGTDTSTRALLGPGHFLARLPMHRLVLGVAAALLLEAGKVDAAIVGGTGEWRVRTGDYRIVYEIDDGVLRVLVLAIGHRREIYRGR